MKTQAAMRAPVGNHESIASHAVEWFRNHKRVGIGIGAIVAVILVGVTALVLVGGGSGESVKISKNPVVASYQKQLPALAEKVHQHPNDAAALQNYAVALYATGDISQAKEQYEAERKISQSDPILMNNLGNVYRDLGTYPKALEAYQKSIALDAKSANAYVNLANLYNYTLNQKQLGITTLQAGRKSLPDNPDLGVLLGIAYEQNKDPGNARTAFDAVLKQDPANAAAHAGIARLDA